MKTLFNSPIASNLLEQAFTAILDAAVIEETAITNFLNFENELIQKAKKDAANLEEFISLNESVNRIIRNITKMKMITQMKLQNLRNMIQTIENLNQSVLPEK